MVEAGESRTPINAAGDSPGDNEEHQPNQCANCLAHYAFASDNGGKPPGSLPGDLVYKFLDQLTQLGKIAEEMKILLRADFHN